MSKFSISGLPRFAPLSLVPSAIWRSMGYAICPVFELPKLPRMADSAKWITACLGNDSFLRQQRYQ